MEDGIWGKQVNSWGPARAPALEVGKKSGVKIQDTGEAEVWGLADRMDHRRESGLRLSCGD